MLFTQSVRPNKSTSKRSKWSWSGPDSSLTGSWSTILGFGLTVVIDLEIVLNPRYSGICWLVESWRGTVVVKDYRIWYDWEKLKGRSKCVKTKSKSSGFSKNDSALRSRWGSQCWNVESGCWRIRRWHQGLVWCGKKQWLWRKNCIGWPETAVPIRHAA